MGGDAKETLEKPMKESGPLAFIDPAVTAGMTQTREAAKATDKYTPASETKAAIAEEQRASEAEEARMLKDAQLSEEERRRRMSIFQTEGGSSGQEVLSVRQGRGNIFGN